MNAHLIQRGHHLALLQGSQTFFPALIDTIDRSVHEVRLETYIFSTQGSGDAVAQALERAALRGVQVFVVMDGVGTPALSDMWAQRWDTAGVAWRIYLPLGRLGLLIPSRWRRLHRKLCVIDEAVLFCGGINVLDDFIDSNHGLLQSPRLDFSVRVHGPLVQDAHACMLNFWNYLKTVQNFREAELSLAWRSIVQTQRSARAKEKMAQSAETPRAQVKAGLVLRDNLLHRHHIERAYRQALGDARHTIIIANAYFLPGRKIRQALKHAASRGLRVRLLLQGRYEYFMQYHATRALYQPMLAVGIEIYEYQASFLHAKVAVIDGAWSTVGSSNMDPLSLLLAREANVVVYDTAFAAQLSAQLEQAIQGGAIRVDALAHARRPWLQKVLDQLASLFMQGLLLLNGKRY
jgi:cardiolipin synthase